MNSAARRRRTSNDGLLTWAHVDMVQRKLRALADGTHTDCLFLVGYDDKSAQVTKLPTLLSHLIRGDKCFALNFST